MAEQNFPGITTGFAIIDTLQVWVTGIILSNYFYINALLS